MGPGTDQFKDQCFLHYLIDQKPVRLDMAFPHTLIVTGSGQGVVTVLFRQGLLCAEQCDHGLELFGVTAAFDCKLIILFELAGEFRFKH